MPGGAPARAPRHLRMPRRPRKAENPEKPTGTSHFSPIGHDRARAPRSPPPLPAGLLRHRRQQAAVRTLPSVARYAAQPQQARLSPPLTLCRLSPALSDRPQHRSKFHPPTSLEFTAAHNSCRPDPRVLARDSGATHPQINITGDSLLARSGSVSNPLQLAVESITPESSPLHSEYKDNLIILIRSDLFGCAAL